MKKLLLVILSLSLVFTSCHKRLEHNLPELDIENVDQYGSSVKIQGIVLEVVDVNMLHNHLEYLSKGDVLIDCGFVNSDILQKLKKRKDRLLSRKSLVPVSYEENDVYPVVVVLKNSDIKLIKGDKVVFNGFWYGYNSPSKEVPYTQLLMEPIEGMKAK